MEATYLELGRTGSVVGMCLRRCHTRWPTLKAKMSQNIVKSGSGEWTEGALRSLPQFQTDPRHRQAANISLQEAMRFSQFSKINSM